MARQHRRTGSKGSLASIATMSSVVTTGNSVYEDAVESHSLTSDEDGDSNEDEDSRGSLSAIKSERSVGLDRFGSADSFLSRSRSYHRADNPAAGCKVSGGPSSIAAHVTSLSVTFRERGSRNKTSSKAQHAPSEPSG